MPSQVRRRFLIATCFVLASAPAASDQTAEEFGYRVKAAILYNIAKFVEWPAAADRDAATFCVVGEDPFGSILDQTLLGKQIKGRPVVLRRLRAGDDLKGCRILFIGNSEDRRFDSILQALGARACLTVSEIPRFTDRGGMIEFVLDGGRVRFQVNPSAAERAGLRISSQLLELARAVRPGGAGPK